MLVLTGMHMTDTCGNVSYHFESTDKDGKITEIGMWVTGRESKKINKMVKKVTTGVLFGYIKKVKIY